MPFDVLSNIAFLCNQDAVFTQRPDEEISERTKDQHSSSGTNYNFKCKFFVMRENDNSKRSDIEKHLTIKNCGSTFLKNILRFKN